MCCNILILLDLALPCYQEFFAFCEAMELVPKEELESFAQATSNTFADRRAQKVGLDICLGSALPCLTKYC